MTDVLKDALVLAQRGLLILPLRPGEKSPALKGWQESATSVPEEIERLLGQVPGCNLGVATGERSGVFVLDIDTKHADGWVSLLDLEVEHGHLPPTWAVDTPSGGAHLWLRYPAGLRRGNRARFRPGLDIRGEGGLVAVPPSSIPGVGAYRWRAPPWNHSLADAPDWLLELLRAPATREPSWQRNALTVSSGDLSGAGVAAELARQAGRVAAAPPGARNDTLFKATAELAPLVEAGILRRGFADAALECAAEECGLVRDDGLASVHATIDSGLRRIPAKLADRAT